MLLPALARAKESGKRIACLNNLRQLSLAAQMYVGDNQGFYPPRSDTDRWPDKFYDSYGKNLKLLLCPSETTNYSRLHRRRFQLKQRGRRRAAQLFHQRLERLFRRHPGRGYFDRLTLKAEIIPSGFKESVIMHPERHDYSSAKKSPTKVIFTWICWKMAVTISAAFLIKSVTMAKTGRTMLFPMAARDI